MNIRVKAALLTAGMLAASTIIFLAIGVIVNSLTGDQLMTLVGIAFIVFFVYILYGITLSRLEFDAKIKEIRDQK